MTLIIGYLTERGVMDASLLYESPFTESAPTGPEGLFSAVKVEDLLAILETVKTRAKTLA